MQKEAVVLGTVVFLGVMRAVGAKYAGMERFLLHVDVVSSKLVYAYKIKENHQYCCVDKGTGTGRYSREMIAF